MNIDWVLVLFTILFVLEIGWLFNDYKLIRREGTNGRNLAKLLTDFSTFLVAGFFILNILVGVPVFLALLLFVIWLALTGLSFVLASKSRPSHLP